MPKSKTKGMPKPTVVRTCNVLVNGAGANVRAEMARANVTQTDIGRILKRSHSAVSRRLRGETPFRADELHRIAKHLGIEVALLYDDDLEQATA